MNQCYNNQSTGPTLYQTLLLQILRVKKVTKSFLIYIARLFQSLRKDQQNKSTTNVLLVQ